MTQVTLGKSGLKVGQIGFGAMSLTWQAKPIEHSEGIKVIKAAIVSGSTLINAGNFYGPPTDPYANIKLIRAFIDAHPDYADKFILSVKGGMDTAGYMEKGMPGLAPMPTADNVRRDLEEARKILGEAKRVDIFEVARVKKDVPIEEQMKTLDSLRKEGLFDHISLSEIGASSIRRAAKVVDIAAVEVEYSPFELSVETNGVLEACEELNIPIFAYSPVGKGLLTGTITSRDQIPAGDVRLHLDRFSDEHFSKNLDLAAAFGDIAKAKGVTPSQFCLAWLVSQSKKGIIIPIPGTTKAERAVENNGAVKVTVTKEDDAKIRDLISRLPPSGGRYTAAAREHMNLFGDTV